MQTLQPMREEVFQGFMGLDRRTDRLNTPPSFLFDHLNGYIKKEVEGNLTWVVQRNGSAKFNAVQVATATFGSNNIVKTIFEPKWKAGGTDIFIKAGTGWGIYDGVNTFNLLVGSRPDNVIGQACMYQNRTILVDGGIPQAVQSSYSVGAISVDASMPQDATACWVHGDKLWLNSASDPMGAYYSNTNDAFSSAAWSTVNNSGKIDLSTILPIGDKILAFRTLGGSTINILAIICQKYTVLFLAGADPTAFQVLRIIKSSCVSGQAIDYIGSDVVYFSQNQMTTVFSAYQNNDLETTSMTKYIEPFYRDQVSQVGTPEAISGVFDKVLNLFYFTLPITNNYQTFVYSTDLGNIVGRWTYPFNIQCMCIRGNGAVLAGADNGYVYILNTGTNDDGTAISWKFATPFLYFGTPQKFKKPVEFETLLQASSSLSLQLNYWYGLSNLATDRQTKTISITTVQSLWDVSLWDVSYWDASGNILYNTPDLVGRGRGMFIELSHSTLNALIALPWFVIRYNLEGRN